MFGFLLGVMLVFWVVQAVDAAPVTFTDTTEFGQFATNPVEDLIDYGGQFVNKLEHGGDFLLWAHNFSFVPPAAEVLSGALTLWLQDDAADPSSNPFEFGFVFAEDGTFDFGEVDTGSISYNVTASFLEDGEFRVFVGSLFGDFLLNHSELEVTYNPVPIPGTLYLLGFGLVGLIGLRRRQKP
jgi:hypothetical protein